jgi:hypothetical protein
MLYLSPLNPNLQALIFWKERFEIGKEFQLYLSTNFSQTRETSVAVHKPAQVNKRPPIISISSGRTSKFGNSFRTNPSLMRTWFVRKRVSRRSAENEIMEDDYASFIRRSEEFDERAPASKGHTVKKGTDITERDMI